MRLQIQEEQRYPTPEATESRTRVEGQFRIQVGQRWPTPAGWAFQMQGAMPYQARAVREYQTPVEVRSPIRGAQRQAMEGCHLRQGKGCVLRRMEASV